jgi:hypothetical protein
MEAGAPGPLLAKAIAPFDSPLLRLVVAVRLSGRFGRMASLESTFAGKEAPS